MLDQADKEWISARFVTKDDCNDTQVVISEKLSKNDTRIQLFEQQMKIWSKLFWVIATATVGQLIVSIFGKLVR